MDLAKHIEENKSQAVDTLKELIRIRSDAGDPVTTPSGEVYPFGQGVQDAFAYMLKKAEEYGFETANADNYGGHIDFGSGDKTVGIIGHLDVVPAGDGWDFDAYSGAESDGYIYGRGTTDDKGPLLACFFAMKALKDAGYEPQRRIRLIMGLDEETNWIGVQHYKEKLGNPDYGFTPDGDFPILNGEKGMIGFDIAKKLSPSPKEGLILSKLSGGTAANMVPEHARAVVRSNDPEAYDHIKDLVEEYRNETGYKVKTKGVGKSLEITAEGVAAHGAAPQDGLNAISILFAFLGKLTFVNDDLNVFIDFYNKCVGFNVYGKNMNLDFHDEKSGKLSFNNGLVNYDGESISVNINIRYPISANADKIYGAVMPFIDKYDLGVVKQGDMKPIYFDTNSNVIRTLVGVYRDKTGDMESQPIVVGGGTYAKAFDNVVAYGGLFPGDPDIMHQKNEKLEIKRYYQMIEIYADAIYKMSQPDFEL
ncbi:MAG: dipeptidase PepV [Clostridiales bacterium]|nr:dipeptidase PepV [Clostridiales bacterium]